MGTERLIKRYTNRKLYDTLESRYVTLEEIARLVREGADVRVVDNESGEDLTSVTFAQIILEEERRKTHLVSVPFLRKLIRSGEARVQDLSDRASRGFEVIGDITEKAGDRLRGVVKGGSKAIEGSREFVDDILNVPQKRLEKFRDAARKSVESIRSNPTVQRELERVASSLHAIEDAVDKLRDEGVLEDEEDMDIESEADTENRSSGGSSHGSGRGASGWSEVRPDNNDGGNGPEDDSVESVEPAGEDKAKAGY